MPFDENDVPAEVQDILAHLPRPMRQRVLADYETHYAPFLALLAGWKGAVQTHYTLGQASALARLEEQFFPLGNWNFPSQALAIPQRPPERTADVPFEEPFSEPPGHPWISCGRGWLQPTTLRELSLRSEGAGNLNLTLDVEQVGNAPIEALLARGQLAFVAAPDEVVGALARGQWWVQTATGALRPAVCARYDGYLLFEREMQAGRLNQRQLDLWLPPFHPYSRKMICLRLATSDEIRQAAWDAGPEMMVPSRARTGFRFLAALSGLDKHVAQILGGQGAATTAPADASTSTDLFYLNAIPVVQTAVMDNLFYAPFPRVGQEYALRVSGLPNLFAAVAYNDGALAPASLLRVPSNDPRASEPDVEVRIAQAPQAKKMRVKLYHGSRGREPGSGVGDARRILERPPQRFAVPFPALGGTSVGGPDSRAEWVRTAWHHGVLRPPLLTEGDLVEIIRQRASSVGALDGLLHFAHAVREIVHQSDEHNGAGAHWKSYLWPSLLVREDRLASDGAEDVFSRREEYVPLVQQLRITFGRGSQSQGIPAFLLADAANYLASVLSQYFVVSCFRVEGQIAP